MSSRQYPWPSIVGAIASGWFVLSHLSQRWLVAGEPTAVLVPVLICMTICVACVVDASIGLLPARARPDDNSHVVDGSEAAPPSDSRMRLFWYLGSLSAFAVLIEPIGFVGSVLLIMPLLLFFGEGLPLRRAVTITVCTGAVVYLVFVRFLGVDLPSGWLFYNYW